MPEMTKKEFAVRLLFWLLPWPISKILPRSLRIYYFGPSGGPPPGWYDYYGIPQWFWPDVPPFEDVIDEPPYEEPPWWPPDAPPYDDFIDSPPDEPPPWWPVDPYNPPPPDQFPDLPDGPVNPGDPYIPGPGPGPSPPTGPRYKLFFDNTFWQPKANGFDRAVWDNVNKHWDSVSIAGLSQVELEPIGTWYLGARFSTIMFTFTVHDSVAFHLVDSDEEWIRHQDPAINWVYYSLDFSRGVDIGFIRFHAPEDIAFSLTSIWLI